MAKTIISLKNIAIPAKTIIIRDLNDVAIQTATILEVSDTNSYDSIKWSTDLYNAVNNDEILVVIDGVEQDKNYSLAYLRDNTVIGGTIIEKIDNLDEQKLVQKECTGYPNRVDSEMSFDDGTRTFTIQPIGVSFDFWRQGTKHTVSVPKTLIIPDVTAKYYIYFDEFGDLSYTVSFNSQLLNDKVITATVYWNATEQSCEFLTEERHGLTMDWATHFHLHNSFGTRYYGGFGISYTTLLGTGSTDSDAQIVLGGGRIADEDIETTIVDNPAPSSIFEQILSPIAEIPVIYRLDNAEWYKDVATTFPVKHNGVSKLQYNDTVSVINALVDVTDGYYVAVWLLACPIHNTPILARIGTREDATLIDAQANNTYESIDWGALPSAEYKVLYRLIFQSDSNYTNTINAVLRDVYDVRGTIDSSLLSDVNNPVTNHGNLTGLSNDDHLIYHTDSRGDLRYVLKNSPISANTFSKITYDAKGLVISGDTLSTDELASGSTNFFVDSNQKDAIDNADNPNAGNPFLTESAANALYLTGDSTNWSWTGSRDTNGSTDRDMRVSDVLTNDTNLVIPVNCRLIGISASTNGNETWQAHVYKNGTSVASLTMTAQASNQNFALAISFAAGDLVRLRQQNGTGNINQPRITVFFKQT